VDPDVHCNCARCSSCAKCERVRGGATGVPPVSHMTRIGSRSPPGPALFTPQPHLPSTSPLACFPAKEKRQTSPAFVCTWDLLRYVYPIGHISSTSHYCVPCTAETVIMPFDHHHHRPPPTPPPPHPHSRLLHTHHHGVMRHGSSAFGHPHFAHLAHPHIMPVFTTLAQRPGLQSLIVDLLPVLSTTQTYTRKRHRWPSWKRSKAANRRTSCCAVSHQSNTTIRHITVSQTRSQI
jgi:hypothetical protein